jgi:hypothetical protein
VRAYGKKIAVRRIESKILEFGPKLGEPKRFNVLRQFAVEIENEDPIESVVHDQETIFEIGKARSFQSSDAASLLINELVQTVGPVRGNRTETE